MINKNYKPKFITFEGVEGCGKSTQSKMLYEYLVSQNIKVILTREVGGTKEAESIRDILLHSTDLLPMSELMLVMAARYEHIHKVIIPALKNGIWVVCDRFIDSTVAYQGQDKNIGAEMVYEMHMQIHGLLPDITFFIDLRPDIALKRTIGRSDNNKFEDKGLDFHYKVYNEFLMLANKFKDRIVKIEAMNITKESVHDRIISLIS